MKTPEEIKKGLRLFASELDDIVAVCDTHDATGLLCEARNRMFEAANLIEEMDSDLCAWGDVASPPGAVEDMARENYRLTERLAQVERERDAAVNDVQSLCATNYFSGDYCEYCKYREPDGQCFHDCTPYSSEWGWEWRGVCAEKTEEEGK